MQAELKENRSHGTAEYPYTQYHIFKVESSFQFPVHWHSELELIFVRKGTLSVSIDGQNYIATSNSLCIVNPRELHFMGSYDTSVDYYTILFPLEFISFQTNDNYENQLLMPLRHGKISFRGFINSSEMTVELHNLLEELIYINKHKVDFYEISCRVLLLKILMELQKLPNILSSSEGSNSNLQRSILTYIRENFAEKIGLSELAEEFHMSDKYLSRYFKEHFNITFSKYLNHMRLSHAKKLLENTDLSVTDVALQSGFPTVSYFISCFKNNYRETPFSYRKH